MTFNYIDFWCKRKLNDHFQEFKSMTANKIKDWVGIILNIIEIQIHVYLLLVPQLMLKQYVFWNISSNNDNTAYMNLNYYKN